MYLDLRETMCYGLFFDGGQPYELGTEKLFRKVLKPGNTMVDIGANVGYYTRLASRLVGASGTVLAFEPNPVASQVLRMNCADLPNVTLFPMAVSDKRGETTFYVRRRGEMSSLSPDPNAKAVRITTGTVDDTLEGYSRIDFVKIDVEGFELEVLHGSDKTLKRCRPVVYFELLPSFAAERGFRFGDYVAFFGQYDYELRWIDHSEAESILVRDKPSDPGYVVALPRDRMHLLA